MHILLVEDHQDIAKNIQEYLATEGYQVDIAHDGEKGLSLFQKKFYELVLLDLMLPKIDGIQVAKTIRETREVPIIMLTAKGQLEDKIEGFNVGADDYLVKPFDLQELLVRIQAIRKRFDEPEKFTFKDIEILLDQKKAFKNGKEINLTNKEFQILEYLLSNLGIAVTRTDILDEIWGEDLFQNDDKLDVYISQIRKKLDKDLIQTVKGFGYKIEK